jgi:hypothetical protein
MIDKFNLPTTTKLNAVAKVMGMFDLPDGYWKSDLVIINPPFSNRGITGSKTSQYYYWKFITKAKKHLNPGGQLVFIAPNTWESALNKESRDGRYEVLEYNASFGKHPPASVVLWTEGAFEVINGRDSRKPEVPDFDVVVLSTGKDKDRGPWEAGVGDFFNLLDSEKKAGPMDVLFSGPDSVACARWIMENKESIVHYWGKAAGVNRLKTTTIKELLRK